MAPEPLPVRVSHFFTTRHQPLVSGARPQLFQLSFARERAATEQQQQGLFPFGSPHSSSCWAPQAAESYSQRPGAKNGVDDKSPEQNTEQARQQPTSTPRARPQAKMPTQETTSRQETNNLEISVQLSSLLFFEQRWNPKTPRLSQFIAIQNPSLKKSPLKFFQCDSTTVRRPLARIALLARSLCEARFHLANLAGYLAVSKTAHLAAFSLPQCQTRSSCLSRNDILSLNTAPWRGAHV